MPGDNGIVYDHTFEDPVQPLDIITLKCKNNQDFGNGIHFYISQFYQIKLESSQGQVVTNSEQDEVIPKLDAGASCWYYVDFINYY